MWQSADRKLLFAPGADAGRQAVAGVPLGRIAQAAHAVGVLRGSREGWRTGLFASEVGGLQFELLTRREGVGRHAIRSVQLVEGERPEEELLVTSHFTVTVEWQPALAIPDVASLKALAARTGVYRILVSGALHYVGKAFNIRSRFQDRFKTFHDFRIEEALSRPWMQRVQVEQGLVSVRGPERHLWFRSRGRRSLASKVKGLLLALEQHLIAQQRPPGNVTREAVVLQGDASITLEEKGAGRSPSTRRLTQSY